MNVLLTGDYVVVKITTAKNYYSSLYNMETTLSARQRTRVPEIKKETIKWDVLWTCIELICKGV